MPGRAEVCVLFALDRERAPFERRLRALGAAGTGISAHTAGFGPAAARFAARLAALPAPERPGLVLVAGVAGALAPGLEVGDIVAADALVTDAGPAAARPDGAALAGLEGARCGALLSVDRVLVTAAEKAAARAGPGAPLAVEMETAGVAAALAPAGIAWAAVRAISDTAAADLPLDFNRLRAPDGGLPPARVALAALRRPAAFPGLLRLGRDADRAAAALAVFLCARLPGLARPRGGC